MILVKLACQHWNVRVETLSHAAGCMPNTDVRRRGTVTLQAAGTLAVVLQDVFAVHGRRLFKEDESEDRVGTETGIVGSESLPQTQYALPSNELVEYVLRGRNTLFKRRCTYVGRENFVWQVSNDCNTK